jgi:hypothetical protein
VKGATDGFVALGTDELDELAVDELVGVVVAVDPDVAAVDAVPLLVVGVGGGDGRVVGDPPGGDVAALPRTAVTGGATAGRTVVDVDGVVDVVTSALPSSVTVVDMVESVSPSTVGTGSRESAGVSESPPARGSRTSPPTRSATSAPVPVTAARRRLMCPARASTASCAAAIETSPPARRSNSSLSRSSSKSFMMVPGNGE